MNRTVEYVFIVNAYERMDGIYVFRNEPDADEFAAVLDAAGVPHRQTRETVCHRPETEALIEAEMGELVPERDLPRDDYNPNCEVRE
jgi:hypothetical protein